MSPYIAYMDPMGKGWLIPINIPIVQPIAKIHWDIGTYIKSIPKLIGPKPWTMKKHHILVLQ